VEGNLDEFQATELLPAASLCSDAGLFTCHIHVHQHFTGFVKKRIIAVTKKADRPAYDIQYSCRTQLLAFNCTVISS